MRKILIVGGSGFVGTNLALAVMERGDHPIIADIKTPFLDIFNYRDYINFDLTDVIIKPDMIKAIRTADVIINCAAQTSHSISMSDPERDARVNCEGQIRLLNLLKNYKFKGNFIYISSSTVVGFSPVSINDDTATHPIDIYSAHKLLVEKYCYIYHNAYGLKTIILRFPNLYGSFGNPDGSYGFFNHFIRLAESGKNLRVYGSGDQLRSFLYIKDATDAILVASNSPPPHLSYGYPYFAVSDEHLSIFEIAVKIANKWGVEVVSSDWPHDRQKIDVGDVHIKTSLFKTLTSWKPKFNIDSGLKDIKCES